ncbi:2-polyprenyl-6-methoxyphenol hydroxylase-like FAD-dependent oxidoreductase [Nonomuraea thailandensis]|uniref:2-polyprenyl-6-methoxyphenol hydroxylase-like FAD-dependent oxidoreductase n=1 Tax=Nonomuraea thailandensis TaxID=1188745 RepID=A0A9X2H177_9ACTN|nr:FAD-dependent monooxygenase [Nonomuraea thailandensis]MCP2364078.1 2-polyprenyl-6-methoxyphenol hydroxylase-like FAD-dependent oxidoreductase [Nonomuraea thailandensis]
MNNTDVLIAGAGPTGLTLAVDLARRGVACRVVDQAPEPAAGSKGKGLQPRTLEVFDDLGVIAPILAAATPYPPLRVRIGRVPVWRARMHRRATATDAVPYPTVVMHPQWRTEAVLRERLGELGGKVEQGVALTGFEQDAGGVTARLGTGESVRARYLVAADGGRSTVRKALGIGFTGETRKEQRSALADVRAEGLDREHIHVWVRPGSGMVALYPMAGTGAFQLLASLRPGVEPEQTLAWYQRMFAQRSMRRDVRLTELLWSSLYRVNIRLADRYRSGRVFLAGDAAHVHPPEGGQGLNTGVQDAYNLGWKLGRVLAGAPESLLDTYEEERRPIAAGVLGLSSDLHDKKSIRRDPETYQLTLSYRGGSLAANGGDRVPDGPVEPVGGRRARLFDLLRGPHFTLLSPDPAPRVPGGPEVRAYVPARPYGGARHTLIRPDGYVGVATSSAEELAAYLAMV